MKNQYVADINDYKKYLVIEGLSHHYQSIDVCWMLTEDDNRQDGRKTSYLFDESQREDVVIYDFLKQIVKDDIKDVRAIESGNILPVRRYYQKLNHIDINNTPELLFIDPDNGVEVKSVPYGKPGFERYVYFEDIVRLLNAGSDLLIYQHYPRVNHIRYQNQRTSQIREHLCDVEIIHYDRGMVDFILIKRIG